MAAVYAAGLPSFLYAEVPSVRQSSALQTVMTGLSNGLAGASGFDEVPKLAVCTARADGSLTLLSDLDFQVRCVPHVWRSPTDRLHELQSGAGVLRCGCAFLPAERGPLVATVARAGLVECWRRVLCVCR